MKLKTVHVSRSGLEKFLGRLEATIMLAAWKKGNRTVREIHKAIISDDSQDYALTTIQTVILRLTAKGLLRKEKIRGVYHFYPTFPNERAFIEAAIRLTLLSIIDDYGVELTAILKPMILQGEIAK